MRKLTQLVFLLTVILSLVSGHCLKAQEDTIRDITKPFLDKAHKAGLVIGTVTPNQTRFYQIGQIHPDSGRKPQPTDYFSIGSITKVFTTLILQDQLMKGRLLLDTPVGAFLPDSIPMPEKGDQVITLKHLATHTSGLPKIDFAYHKTGEGQKHPLNPYKTYTHEDLYAFLKDYKYPTNPGDSFQYSNLGMALLGHVLEKVTGKSYKTLIHEYSEQMGMDHTATQLKPDEKANYLTGYNRRGMPTPAWDFQVVAPAGAIRSTPRDMLRFVKANLGLVETPFNEALARTHKPIRPLEKGHDNSGQMGLGWMISGKPSAGDQLVFHAGATYGFSAFTGFLKEQQVGVVLMSNTFGNLSKMGVRILRALTEGD